VRIIGFILGLILVLACPSLSVAGKPASLDDGRRLYEANCAICHGTRGDGHGEAAARFATPPRDFTNGVYKFRSTGSGQLPADEDLIRTVTRGIPGTAMVPQDYLSAEDVRSVIAYIKSLTPKFADPSPVRLVPIPPPPEKNKATITAGRKVYEKAGCTECHGAKARGDGPSSTKLAVRPADLTRRPLKSGQAAQDIVRTLLTGLDGTSMPSYHLALADDEIWKLAYYIDSLGGPPQLTKDERLGQEIVRQRAKEKR